jgi:6-phosphogluconolactonase
MMLGLGEDAHIASIFPGSDLLRIERHDRVAAAWAAHLHAWRITLTPAALLDARTVVMVVAGDRKAPAVQAAIERPLDIGRWPAQILRQVDDRVEWTLDRAAAAGLRTGNGVSDRA